jgi:hypothetical protein
MLFFNEFSNLAFLSTIEFFSFLFTPITKNDNPSNGFTWFLSRTFKNHEFSEKRVFS